MTSVGIDRTSGKVLVGWPHVVQSIATILSTSLGERVQRRDFGSNVPAVIDRPQNEETLLAFFIAVAEALEPRMVGRSLYGEPRFQLKAITADFTKIGEVSVGLTGDYLPDGAGGSLERVALRVPITSAALMS